MIMGRGWTFKFASWHLLKTTLLLIWSSLFFFHPILSLPKIGDTIIYNCFPSCITCGVFFSVDFNVFLSFFLPSWVDVFYKAKWNLHSSPGFNHWSKCQHAFRLQSKSSQPLLFMTITGCVHGASILWVFQMWSAFYFELYAHFAYCSNLLDLKGKPYWGWVPGIKKLFLSSVNNKHHHKDSNLFKQYFLLFLKLCSFWPT